MAIAQDQFALATTDWNHGINRQNPRLKRNIHRSAIHNCRSLTLYRPPLAGANGSAFIQRFPCGVNHSSQQPLSNGNIHNPLGSTNFLAGLEIFAFVEQDDGNFLRIQVESYSHPVAREPDQLLRLNVSQAFDAYDVVSHKGYCADLLKTQLRLVTFKGTTNGGKSITERFPELFIHSFFPQKAGDSRKVFAEVLKTDQLSGYPDSWRCSSRFWCLTYSSRHRRSTPEKFRN
ncbi:Uncharacterised protein [uncultured archaeon]|nr:Uncharacterised protein [uncultured archaeon]